MGKSVKVRLLYEAAWYYFTADKSSAFAIIKRIADEVEKEHGKEAPKQA